MSTYTAGMSRHGAGWNKFPIRVGEMTMGDHLRALGMECWLLGKTHMEATPRVWTVSALPPTASWAFASPVWVRPVGA